MLQPSSNDSNSSVLSPPSLKDRIPSSEDIDPPYKASSKLDWELPTDILLLTVQDQEFHSCYYYLENIVCSSFADLGKVYFGEFREPKSEGMVKVALCRCTGKGAGEAQGSLLFVKNAVGILKPKAVFSVGYCGMVNPDKTKLGDVVISAKLATYAPKKVTEDGSEEIRGIRTNVSKKMGALILDAASGWKAPLENPKEYKVDVVRDGVMLSGPELVDNLERRQALLRHCPDAVGLEMEGEGVYAAAHDLEIEWAVVKGISDFADGSKKKTSEWRPFASMMAASVVHNMFKHPAVLESWPNYKKAEGVPSSGSITAATSSAATASWGLALDQFLKSIAGTKEGKKIFNGRKIEYAVSGRVHSLKEPWVFDATATDVESGLTTTAKHFKREERAVDGAVRELMEQLKSKQLIKD